MLLADPVTDPNTLLGGSFLHVESCFLILAISWTNFKVTVLETDLSSYERRKERWSTKGVTQSCHHLGLFQLKHNVPAIKPK